jgi:hypothetical protein
MGSRMRHCGFMSPRVMQCYLLTDIPGQRLPRLNCQDYERAEGNSALRIGAILDETDDVYWH